MRSQRKRASIFYDFSWEEKEAKKKRPSLTDEMEVEVTKIREDYPGMKIMALLNRSIAMQICDIINLIYYDSSINNIEN